MTSRNALFALIVMASAAGCADGPRTRIADRADELRCVAHILIYHEVGSLEGRTAEERENIVSPGHFARQMAYLKREGYAPVQFGRVVDCVKDGAPLPPKAVVITFDDAEAGPYRNALPVLLKYRYPATFFIKTAIVGHGDHLTWDQIRELHRDGMTIGAHTRTHPSLTKVDAARKREEIAGSKRDIELALGRRIEYFAYPNGKFDEASEAAVRAAGFRAARCSDWGTRHVRDQLYEMRGFGENDDMDAFVESMLFIRPRAKPVR